MVFITHKVLNLVHSDTIACVLYELLVCRSLGFGIVFRDFPSRLRFHKFQYCSIFKVLRCLKQLVYFTSSSPVCQVLFWNFLKQSFQSAAVFRTALLKYHIRFDLSTAFLRFSKFSDAALSSQAPPIGYRLCYSKWCYFSTCKCHRQGQNVQKSYFCRIAQFLWLRIGKTAIILCFLIRLSALCASISKSFVRGAISVPE